MPLHTELPKPVVAVPSLAVLLAKDGPTLSAGGMSCVEWQELSDPSVLQPPLVLVTAEFARPANLVIHL